MGFIPVPGTNLRRAICFASTPRTELHFTKTGRARLRRAATVLPAAPASVAPPNRNMKSSLEAPEKQIAEETSAKPAASVIDTSKMSAGKAAALELAEASRDPLDERGSFASNLFIGRYDFDRIFPWPEQSVEDRAAGEDFLASLRKYLREKV